MRRKGRVFNIVFFFLIFAVFLFFNNCGEGKDTTPPQTSIVSSPAEFSNSSSATFTFECGEKGCVYQCRLDGGDWSFCESGVTYNDLAEGAQTLEVVSTDRSGLSDPTPISFTWTVDTIIPETENPVGNFSSVSDTSATFNFSSPESDTIFECNLDYAEWVTCPNPMTFDALTETDHTLEVRAKDLAGNVDPTSSEYTWTNRIGVWNIPPGLATNPILSGLYGHFAFWTGSEMIIYGYSGNYFYVYGGGGKYNPSTDTWTAISVSGDPKHLDVSAVWTGSEMIVWGGRYPTSKYGDNAYYNDGGRYNPATDSWQSTSTVGAPSPRHSPSAVWTGLEMIIWAGGSPTGGRYNPNTDSWRSISTDGAPESDQSAVWTGSEMIVWGGGSHEISVNIGGKYSPSTDSWSPTSRGDNVPPEGLLSATVVWTGTEMIIWGGKIAEIVRTTLSNGYSSDIVYHQTNSGYRYNPSTDSWHLTAVTGAPEQREGHTAVWTGSEMVIWGGLIKRGSYSRPDSQDVATLGGRYNPIYDTWMPTSTLDAPQGRYDHSVVWTGSKMIVWGGDGDIDSATAPLNNGGIYNP